jgi:hypothetical protein
MTHFAKIENGIVTNVIVAEQDVIDSKIFEGKWIQTSYNTHGNVHYDANGNPDGGIALRGNYAGIGHIYDEVNDVFYSPQPYPSWTLNQNTWQWDAPTSYPSDGSIYKWDESIKNWIK